MPIIRSGYAARPNKDNWTRAQNRKALMMFADRCAICGQPAQTDDPFEADHITPVAHGGSDQAHNLRAVHRSFNRSRGAGGVGVCRG